MKLNNSSFIDFIVGKKPKYLYSRVLLFDVAIPEIQLNAFTKSSVLTPLKNNSKNEIKRGKTISNKFMILSLILHFEKIIDASKIIPKNKKSYLNAILIPYNNDDMYKYFVLCFLEKYNKAINDQIIELSA